MTDWDRYRQCPVCFAGLGRPCMTLSGFGPTGPISVEAETPHGGRELRTGVDRG